MSTVTEFPDLERAREEAALWIARMDRGLDTAERESLREWCAASPANPRALRHLSEFWAALDVMQMLPEVIEEVVPANDAAAWSEAPAAPAPARPRRRVARAALAASLAACAVVAGVAIWTQLSPQPAAGAGTEPATAYYTAVGEQREVELADGSRLSINTGSLVEVVSLQGATRDLRLLRGEALFTVAHDPERPFRVHIGEHLVEAVGTAFDIRLHDGGHVDVVVTDGRIRLDTGSATDHADRGDAVRIDSAGALRVTRLDEAAVAARLAWRQGMISFSGQTLAEALDEFSRYTPVRFAVSDPATRQRPVGGTLPAGDVESLLEALRTNLGLESTRAPDGSIRIGPQH